MMNPNRTIKELREELSRLCKVSTQGSWWIDSHGGTMVSFSEDEDMKIVTRGTTRHRYGDGAWVLVAKAMEAAKLTPSLEAEFETFGTPVE